MSGTGFAGRTERAGKARGGRDGPRGQGRTARPGCYWHSGPPPWHSGPPLGIPAPPIVIPAVFSGNPAEGPRTPGPPSPLPSPARGEGGRRVPGRGTSEREKEKREGTPEGREEKMPLFSLPAPSPSFPPACPPVIPAGPPLVLPAGPPLVIPAVFSGNPAEGPRTPGPPPHPCPLPPGEREEEGCRGEGRVKGKRRSVKELPRGEGKEGRFFPFPRPHRPSRRLAPLSFPPAPPSCPSRWLTLLSFPQSLAGIQGKA